MLQFYAPTCAWTSVDGWGWLIALHEVHACKKGVSIRTTFSDGLRAEVINGAEVGRCEYLN